jgi:hypothetical protein
MTSFLTFDSCSKISSTTGTIKVVSFSSFLFATFFIVLFTDTNSPITLSASSCSGTNYCWRILCCSLIWFISVYDFLLTRMATMCSYGGGVLMFSEAFYTFSYASLNLASMFFIYGSSIIFIQNYMFSSHSFVHSSYKLLILSTEVIVVLSLCSFSSFGVLGVVHDFKSLILMQNPLINSLIF